MKIQGDDDAGVPSDKAAHEGDDAAIGVLIVGCKHGAVIGDVDGIQGARLCQACSNRLEEPVHQRPIDRAVWVAPGQQDGQRGPGSGGIHRLHERRGLAHDQRIGSPRSFEDCRALEVIVTLEIVVRGDWRLPIALEPDTDNGYARTFHAVPTLCVRVPDRQSEACDLFKMPCCLQQVHNGCPK